MKNLVILIAAFVAAMIASCASAPKPAITPDTTPPVMATIHKCDYYEFASETVEFLANQEACGLTQETMRVFVEREAFGVRKAGTCMYNKAGTQKILKLMDANRDCVITAKEENAFEMKVVTTLLASGKTELTGPEAFRIVFPNGN